MSAASIRPFEADDIPAAGALLAARHRSHRLTCPLLPGRFEDEPTASAEVEAAFAMPDASGAVATRGGDVVGFLLGAPKSNPSWGTNIWVEAAGQATSEPELMRDLYASAATRWVDEGRTAQYVLVPASDEDLLRAWYRLGFGQQHAHAALPLPAARTRDAALPVPPKILVRTARRDDLAALARLEIELPRHLGVAPVFSAVLAPSYEESLAGWEEDFDDPAYAIFVAEADGVVVGSAIGCSVELSPGHRSLARPDNAGLLSFAAVFPQARGLGVGRALGEAVIAWAAEAGYSCVVTDWRVTNLPSSRTWPRLGFAESFLRLHRHIGY